MTRKCWTWSFNHATWNWFPPPWHFPFPVFLVSWLRHTLPRSPLWPEVTWVTNTQEEPCATIGAEMDGMPDGEWGVKRCLGWRYLMTWSERPRKTPTWYRMLHRFHRFQVMFVSLDFVISWHVEISQSFGQRVQLHPKLIRLINFIPPGWWFQTFYMFHNIWDNPSHWLIFFKGVETTNQPL